MKKSNTLKNIEIQNPASTSTNGIHVVTTLSSFFVSHWWIVSYFSVLYSPGAYLPRFVCFSNTYILVMAPYLPHDPRLPLPVSPFWLLFQLIFLKKCWTKKVPFKECVPSFSKPYSRYKFQTYFLYYNNFIFSTSRDIHDFSSSAIFSLGIRFQ